MQNKRNFSLRYENIYHPWYYDIALIKKPRTKINNKLLIFFNAVLLSIFCVYLLWHLWLVTLLIVGLVSVRFAMQHLTREHFKNHFWLKVAGSWILSKSMISYFMLVLGTRYSVFVCESPICFFMFHVFHHLIILLRREYHKV